MKASKLTMLLSLSSVAISLSVVDAENGLNGWLRYAPLPNANTLHAALASNIVALNTSKSSPVYAASLELQKVIQSIFSQAVKISENSHKPSFSVIVGTVDDYLKGYGDDDEVPELVEDGF